MVSTRRSGSLPSNNSKRSSSPSDDTHNKPSSPKRQKALSLSLSLQTHVDKELSAPSFLDYSIRAVDFEIFFCFSLLSQGESCSDKIKSNNPNASEASPAENPKEISSTDPPDVAIPAAADAAGTSVPDAAAAVSLATPVVAEGQFQRLLRWCGNSCFFGYVHVQKC